MVKAIKTKTICWEVKKKKIAHLNGFLKIHNVMCLTLSLYFANWVSSNAVFHADQAAQP